MTSENISVLEILSSSKCHQRLKIVTNIMFLSIKAIYNAWERCIIICGTDSVQIIVSAFGWELQCH